MICNVAPTFPLLFNFLLSGLSLVVLTRKLKSIIMPLQTPSSSTTELHRQRVFEDYITGVQEMIDAIAEANIGASSNNNHSLKMLADMGKTVEKRYKELTDNDQWLTGFPSLATVKRNAAQRLSNRKRKAELEHRMEEIRKATSEVEMAWKDLHQDDDRGRSGDRLEGRNLSQMESKLDALERATAKRRRTN